MSSSRRWMLIVGAALPWLAACEESGPVAEPPAISQQTPAEEPADQPRPTSMMPTGASSAHGKARQAADRVVGDLEARSREAEKQIDDGGG